MLIKNFHTDQNQSSLESVRTNWQGNYSNSKSPVKFVPKEMPSKHEESPAKQDPNRMKMSKSCDDLENRATNNVENKNRDSIKFTFALKDQQEERVLTDSNNHGTAKIYKDSDKFYLGDYLYQTRPKIIDDMPRKSDLNGQSQEKNDELAERKLLEVQLAEIENQIATCQRSIEQLTDQITSKISNCYYFSW